MVQKVEILKMVSQMDAILKAKFNLKSKSQLITFSDSFQQQLYLENLTGMLLLFSPLQNIQDGVQIGSKNIVGNHLVFVIYTARKKITGLLFFIFVYVDFVFVLVIVSINFQTTFDRIW